MCDRPGRIACVLLVLALSLSALAAPTYRGTVVDVGDKPVAGATVVAYGLDESGGLLTIKALGEAVTLEDGGFTIDVSVAPGEYVFLLADKEPYALGWGGVSPLVPRGALRIELTEAHALEGAVVDGEGHPVEGATVRAVLRRRDAEIFAIGLPPVERLARTTDAQGRFRFERLPEDATAALLAAAPGLATPLPEVETWAAGLPYRPGQQGIRLEMRPGGRLHGRVVRASDEQPVEGVRVAAVADAPMLPATAVTDAEGRFAIAGLADGQYVLRIVPPEQGVGDWVTAGPEVSVQSGQTAEAQLQAHPGSILEIRVENEQGQPVAGVSAYLLPEGGPTPNRPPARIGPTDAQGEARLRIAAGEYEVLGVGAEGYRSGGDVSVTAGDDGEAVSLVVTVVKMPTLSGIVRDPQGRPVAGAWVASAEFVWTSAITDGEGRFELPLNMPSDFMPERLTVRHQRRNLVASAAIEDAEEPLAVTLAPGVRASGRVLDEAGKPIANAMVATGDARAIAMMGVGAERTDAEGRYTIAALLPDEDQEITAWREGYGSGTATVFAGDAEQGVVQVETIVLPVADQTVSGVVRDGSGKPVAGARVMAESAGPSRGTMAVTDEQGRFTIENLVAGEVNLHTFGEDGFASGSVEAGTAEAQNVELILESHAPMGPGRVPSEGEPAPDDF